MGQTFRVTDFGSKFCHEQKSELVAVISFSQARFLISKILEPKKIKITPTKLKNTPEKVKYMHFLCSILHFTEIFQPPVVPATNIRYDSGVRGVGARDLFEFIIS